MYSRKGIKVVVGGMLLFVIYSTQHAHISISPKMIILE